MAKIDTNRIWRSLGSFFDLFPEDERIYLATFWESWADIVSDLWGLTFQVDRSKSLFSTTATFERRNVLVQLSDFSQQKSFDFELSAITISGNGFTTVRGFVSRENQTFKAAEIPLQGIIRIGVDVVNYISVNVVSVKGGPFDGYVQEAVFTIDGELPHDYQDSVDLNDSFIKTETAVVFRVNQVIGDNYVDTTSNGIALSLNQTGLIRFGTPGLNYEEVEYQSLTVIGDRYIFGLPATWGNGRSGPWTLLSNHPQGEQVLVSVIEPNRWLTSTTGAARIYGDGAVYASIDNEPGLLGASLAKAESQLEIKENTDFDISVSMFVDFWQSSLSGVRISGVKLDVAGTIYVVGLRQNAGVLSLIGGLDSSPISIAQSSVPSQIEFRISRTVNVIEFKAKKFNESDFTLIASIQSTGHRAKMTLFSEDTGTDTSSLVHFDEVVRRLGEAAGSQRLENSFKVDDRYPYRYSTDVQLVSANELRDTPRIKSQQLSVISEIVDEETQYISAIGSGDTFVASGINSSGVIHFVDSGKIIVYDDVVRNGSIFDFKVRGKIDPDLLPLAVGTEFIAETRRLLSSNEYKFNSPGELWLRELPTRDRMWAPIAQEDQRHIQRLYGPLVGLDADASSDAYLKRVQGAWYALMSGPAIENVAIGIHLAMGLPVAQVAGVVQQVFDKYDSLGELKERGMVISSKDGLFTHQLDPTLQGISWLFEPGDFVEKFTRLTGGIDVYDSIVDVDWPERFAMDKNNPEKFNSFGVLVDINTLSSSTSLDDAIRFALRIKPTWTKMIFHLMLTAGNEVIIVEDEGEFLTIAGICEDISFDEGTPPIPIQGMLRMGDGHKMGQGKIMGSNSVFKPYPVFGIGLHMGMNLTMGMEPQAYACRPNSDNLATEELFSVAVIEVEVGP